MSDEDDLMRGDPASDDLPTKDECVAAFWRVIAPALLDLHRQGKLPAPTGPEDIPHDRSA